MSKFEKAATRENPKATWVSPHLHRLKAGSAEVNAGPRDDGDPGTSLNNS